MIFDMNSSRELLEKFQSAQAAESVATKTLLSAMESGNKDTRMLADLSKRMEDAHNNVMDIWSQLQKHRLDV